MPGGMPTERQVQRAILQMCGVCLVYVRDTGKLYWRERTPDMFPDDPHPEGRCRTFNKQFAGKEALTATNKGYRCGQLYGRLVQAHRAAFAIEHGRWPEGQIDHINGNRSDNRACNLREVSNAENHRNEKRPSNSTSGFIGVTFHKATGKWRAHIKSNYRQIHLGLFASKEEAAAARAEAETKLGFHPNHGRST